MRVKTEKVEKRDDFVQHKSNVLKPLKWNHISCIYLTHKKFPRIKSRNKWLSSFFLYYHYSLLSIPWQTQYSIKSHQFHLWEIGLPLVWETRGTWDICITFRPLLLLWCPLSEIEMSDCMKRSNWEQREKKLFFLSYENEKKKKQIARWVHSLCSTSLTHTHTPFFVQNTYKDNDNYIRRL